MCLNLILKRVNSQQQCGNHSPNCLLDLYIYLDEVRCWHMVFTVYSESATKDAFCILIIIIFDYYYFRSWKMLVEQSLPKLSCLHQRVSQLFSLKHVK